MEELHLEGEEKLLCIEADPLEKAILMVNLGRKEKRKALKRMKRKQLRKELALRELQEEEARLNDPDEQRRIRLMKLEEEERLEKEKKLFEERERAWMEAMELKKKKMVEEEEEEQRRIALEEQSRVRQAETETEIQFNEEDDWEYVEGPAEIIWKGEEIILKKKMIRVPKQVSDSHKCKENTNRPTSNPLPPQSEAFMDYKNASVSSRPGIEDIASQVSNFGTEQDKSHCPFHLKTGACRFGQRCSRVHFYPDKSCTLLIKNMYNGPGLAWEQDEGLEYTDEEVERCYEEFYDDVHTEFLKFGEIVNFKVCKNGSFHLRGNVYVHYKSSDSAVLAYNANNGRFYAGKQIICEFVNINRWKVAICGEFMKTRYKTCSHGTVCNFIHCFRNPGGDYEWADSDKPPPRYWMKKMSSLFGYYDEFGYENHIELEKSSKLMATVVDRHHSRRTKFRSLDHSKDAGSDRSNIRDNDDRWARHYHRRDSLAKEQCFGKKAYLKANLNDDRKRKNRPSYADSAKPVDNIEEINNSRDRGCTSISPRNQVSNRITGIENTGHEDSRNTSNGTHSEMYDGDEEKDCHQSKQRKIHAWVSKTTKDEDGSTSSKSILKDDIDAYENCSDNNKVRRHVHGKESKRKRNGWTKASDDRREQKSKMKAYHSKKSSTIKSSRHSNSSYPDLNTRDSHSADSMHSDVVSDESVEPSISDREMFEPLNLDKGFYQHIHKVGRWEPEKSCDEFEKFSETTSEGCESESSDEHGGRSKSVVPSTSYFHGSKVRKQNSCKLRHADLYEHRRFGRTTLEHDDGQDSGNFKSKNKSSDDNSIEKNSRSTSHSRKKSHKLNLEKESNPSNN